MFWYLLVRCTLWFTNVRGIVAAVEWLLTAIDSQNNNSKGDNITNNKQGLLLRLVPGGARIKISEPTKWFGIFNWRTRHFNDPKIKLKPVYIETLKGRRDGRID